MSEIQPADYPAVRAAIHRVLAAVRGVRVVLSYEPKAVQHYPLIYTLLDEVPTAVHGQVQGRTYGMIHRLCVPWQDNEGAEEQIVALVDPVLDALYQAQHDRLGGLIPSGLLTIGTARAGFLPIGGVVQRVIDFSTATLIKGQHLTRRS